MKKKVYRQRKLQAMSNGETVAEKKPIKRTKKAKSKKTNIGGNENA